MSKSKVNFIYQSIYQLLLIILPFVTAPYISRVLGTTGVGIYSYSSSVVSYFTLVIMMGINTYGNREVAKLKDDAKKLSYFFCNLFFMHFLIGIIVVFLYIVYSVLIVTDNKDIFFIQSITLFASVIDINWLFFGLEEFKLTVTRNIIIKILSVFAIFSLVNTANDLWMYTMIMCVSTFIGQAVLWTQVRKQITWIKPDFKSAIKNLRPMLLLFIPTVAVSIYKQMDKVMLGAMATYSEVGIYEYAEKIINAPIGLISALGIVMMPKMAYLYAKSDSKQAHRYIDISMEFIMFMAIACLIGICAVSKDFIPLFFGEEFSGSISVTYILAFSIPVIAWANVIRTQYLLPNGKDNIFIFSLVAGAIINLVLNWYLIPIIGANGAAIGTLATEIIVCIVQSVGTVQELKLTKYLIKCIKFVITGCIMFAAVRLTARNVGQPILAIMLEFLTGIVVYGLLNIRYSLRVLRKNM